MGVFIPNKRANLTIRALFIPREPFTGTLLGNIDVHILHWPPEFPVGFGSSYPHILGTFMYLSHLLALPTGVS